MKLACSADLHARGKDLPAFSRQFSAAVKAAEDCSHFFMAGDVFDLTNIAASDKSVGDIVHAVTSVILSARDIQFVAIPGDHDKENESSMDALACLDGLPNVTVIREPKWLIIGETGVACVPWLYMDSAQDPIDELCNRKPIGLTDSILLAHLQVQGAKMNGGHICDRGRFSISKSFLQRLDFDRFWLGDFHQRQDLTNGRGGYIGSLRQLGYGHVGDPQGIEIYDTETGIAEWVEINEAPRHEVLAWVEGTKQPIPSKGFKTKIKTIGWTPQKAIPGVEISYTAKADHVESRLDADKIATLKDDPHALFDVWLDSIDHEGDRLSLHETLSGIL